VKTEEQVRKKSIDKNIKHSDKNIKHAKKISTDKANERYGCII